MKLCAPRQLHGWRRGCLCHQLVVVVVTPGVALLELVLGQTFSVATEKSAPLGSWEREAYETRVEAQ